MAWEWILSMLGSGAVAAVLLGVAGYLGRTQLAHWLNRDLEQIKAQHARELETYKVSLIADAERAKASQEVRKAIALMMAEKKFAALNRLHGAAEHQASEALSMLTRGVPKNNEAGFAAANARVNEYIQALRSASMYFKEEEKKPFFLLINRVQGVVGLAMSLDKRATGEDYEARENMLLEAQKAVNDILAARLHAMLAMED